MRLLLSASSIFFFLFLSSSIFAQKKWKLAKSPLQTPWTTEVNPDNALPEYPRPQMTRQKWLNLNGVWDAMLVNKQNEEVERQGKVLVPYPVESALSGLGWKVEPKHLIVYNRSFSIPSDWQGQRVLLHFGAVDWETDVFVNTKKAGSHKGGYDPFTLDITKHLKPDGDQHITVQVSDPTDAGGQPIGKQRLQPKGIFYTASSGIWQTVWLEPVPMTYIKSFRVEPDIDKKRLLVRVTTEGDNKNKAIVTTKIFENGQKLSESKGKSGTPHLMHIRNNMRRWSPDDPYLYDLEIELGSGKDADRIKGYFGMRKISLGKDDKDVTRMMLNNQPFFQFGVLDQGFFPDGLHTPPTEAAMKNDIQTIKEMGFNMLRKHVKIEPARWYHLCDKMGMLVWQDMPSGTNSTADGQQQFKWELKAMVDNLFSHPSIVVWVPFNEAWGQHETESYVEQLKIWDPTRLVINASGWTDKGVGDILDIHSYPNPAAPATEKNRAIVLGEFGGLGLNVKGHQWAEKGWGYEIIPSSDVLLQEYEELYRKLLPLKDKAGLSAAVYTQVSDIETENNGLLTYDRKVVKIDPSLVAAAHAGLLPPIPASDVRIFSKNTRIKLSTLNPDATISYSFNGLSPDAEWQNYAGPISIKKTATIHCRASWENGKNTSIREYVFEKVKPLKSKAPKNLSAGISLKQFAGEWEKLPDFLSLKAAKEMTLTSLNLQENSQEKNFGLFFDGWIEILETDIYTFHVESDDGSRLWLANHLLIDNDGLHGMREKSASMALKKGRHPIRLAYFQKAGGLGLEVWMTDTNGDKQKMNLFHQSEIKD